MVGAPKTHHLESESFFPKVGHRAETDRKVDSTHRQGLLSWYDAVEAARTGLELCSINSQEVEGLEVHDVEAAAVVHRYLGESSADDDRVNDEWIDARANDPIRMIVVVECDGGARLVEVLWHCHPRRKDLSMFPLALSGAELCHGPTIDHVAVMDYGEPFIILTSALVVALVFPLVILL